MNSTASLPAHSAPRRVALVITGLGMGGAENCLVNVAERVNTREFELRVFCLQPLPEKNRGEFVTRLEQSGIKIVSLHARSWWQFPFVLWKLWRELRAWQPQVMQSFLYHANVLGTVAARLAGVKKICVSMRVAEPNRWRRCLEQSVCANTSHIYVSKSVRRAYRQQRRTPHIFTIHNGVDVARYERAAPADLSAIIPTNAPLILAAGRLHEQKGFPWMLTCLPELLARIPHHVVIAGEGPLMKTLESTASKLPCAERIHFVGWRNDLPALLRRADVFVSPSRYEGLPNAILEAMAAGVPVVATRVEGVVELLGLELAECGLNYGDSAEFVQKVLSVVTNREKHEHQARQLQQRAREHFSWEKTTRCFEAVWSGD